MSYFLVINLLNYIKTSNFCTSYFESWVFTIATTRKMPVISSMRRTRPVTRGSGTWRKGNNDRSSNRPPRSSSIKKPGDINTILQTVLDRLNDLDKRFNDLTKKPTPTQTNNKITPLLDLETIPQPQTARSEIATAKSINPDFGQLWRCLFKGVQLKHHRNNWETTPLSICKRLEDMGEFITPPDP